MSGSRRPDRTPGHRLPVDDHHHELLPRPAPAASSAAWRLEGWCLSGVCLTLRTAHRVGTILKHVPQDAQIATRYAHYI